MKRTVKIETTIVDGKVLPDVFLVQRDVVYDAAGNPVGLSANHRAPIAIDGGAGKPTIDEQFGLDPKLNLTAAEAKAIKDQITSVKAAMPVAARPTEAPA